MVYLLINPLSNNKKASEKQSYLEDCIKSLFPDSEISVKDITQLGNSVRFYETLEENDVIIVAGGDGTISNFANDVYELHLRQKIFYYPCGSGNDFFNDVKDFVDNPYNLIPFNQFLRSLPYVLINGQKKYFINGIGFGIDGYCCEEGDRIREKSTKKVNYTAIAIKGLLGAFKPVNATVSVDGKNSAFKKVWLAPSMIGRFYGGGMMIAPEQNRLNVEKTVTCVIAHDLASLKILSIFPSIFEGKHTKHKKYIEFIKGHSVKVEFDKPQALQIDGETVSGVTTYSVIYE